jgi:hypothetical protein
MQHAAWFDSPLLHDILKIGPHSLGRIHTAIMSTDSARVR